MRCCGWVVLCLAIAWCVPAGAEEEPGEELQEIRERVDRGEPLDPEQLELFERFARDHLIRVPCHTLEEARFSLAQLQVKAGRGAQAVKTLEALAAATKDPDVKSAALYDVGRVYRHALRDTKSAAEAFRKVTGRFRHQAQRDLLRMYRQAGQSGNAIEFLQSAAAATKDKGEKLALLRQLAELCKKEGRLEDAMAAYRQITEQFTEKDVQGLREGAGKRVRDAFAEARQLQERERWPEADRRIQRVRIWMGQLAAAGRLDEFRAAERELHQAWRELEERERREEQAEEEEEDEDD
jgi:tetratricopeptide (TPR) repeat protein